MKHPIQDVIIDPRGTPRFNENKIVSFLLENNKAGIDMNMLACMEFSKDDRQQFAQLIGYSVYGFSELSYADDDTVQIAELQAKGKGLIEARIEHLESELAALRQALREPMARLFGVHPDDLKRNG